MMPKRERTMLTCILLAAAAAAPGSLPATAAPMAAAAAAVPAGAHERASLIHSRRPRGFGRGLGVRLGIGVLGAIIADQAYRARPGYDYDEAVDDGPPYEPAQSAGDPRNLCAQHFRSFEWNTGLYTPHAGEKRLCPY